MTGEAVEVGRLREAKAAVPGTPVFANTGVTIDSVAEILAIGDGAVRRDPFQGRRQDLQPGRARPRRALHGQGAKFALTMALLLGLDIGTTSTVGIVIDSEGATLGVASRPATLYTPELNWAEEDPAEWWANVGAISRELVSTCGFRPEAIAGIGVTGMLPAIVLLDGQGAVLRRSIQQNDARAVRELERFAAGMAELEFLALTGTGYSQQLVGPKLMWLREHEPEIFAAVQHVFGASDYVTWMVTNSVGIEHNWALEFGFFSTF